MSRRAFLIGAASLLVAPAVVRVASVMPVKPAPLPVLNVITCKPYAIIEIKADGRWVYCDANGVPTGRVFFDPEWTDIVRDSMRASIVESTPALRTAALDTSK